ncbi:hypothetical protein BCR36DRAFT_412970 [Piromyces finnis]|uniref:Rhodopsin n=1 Tax=Piromyces finnis TaxID=1754191 RepID=A0A1Y1V8D1_9FUNG|nr:hypothetical protein BCR36DRAFT_412970 [Piromyces finnis]|eukprot:ORX48963.1 hypothetical protein BCR36DRAFT_412970 [Piromyces finnis]
MNSKLFLLSLFATLLTIVNSLAIDNEITDLKLNDPNAKYSKKVSVSSGGKAVKKGLGKIAKWIIIIIVIIITIIIVTCICCCLGCCSLASSGKKKGKNENNEIPSETPAVTGKPYGSEPEVVDVQPQGSYPPQGTYPPPPQGSYPPPQGSYPPPQGAYPPPPQGSYPTPSPYGQPLYPNVQ